MKRTIMIALLFPLATFAQEPTHVLPEGWDADPPELTSLVTFARQESDLRVAITRYLLDKAAIERRYEVLYSPVRIERLTEFHLGWQQQLGEVDFDGLNAEGRVDYIALRNRIEYDLEVLS